jgi:hypothetical protein
VAPGVGEELVSVKVVGWSAARGRMAGRGMSLAARVWMVSDRRMV